MLTKELGNVDDSAGAHWRDYYALTKPGVVQLLVFTAIVGMFLAVPGMVPWTALIAGSLMITALTFGTMLRSDFTIAWLQLDYAIVFFLLLALRSWNVISIDGMMRSKSKRSGVLAA